MYDPQKRREWKLGRHDDERGPYVIELNLQHIEGLPGAIATLDGLLKSSTARSARRAEYISKTYARVMLTVKEWQRLLAKTGIQAERLRVSDTADEPGAGQSTSRFDVSGDLQVVAGLSSLQPDLPVRGDHQVGCLGQVVWRGRIGIVWAVVDSGIDGVHPHFDLPERSHVRLAGGADLHRCFVDTEAPVHGLGIPFVAPAPQDPDALQRPEPKARQDHDSYF